MSLINRRSGGFNWRPLLLWGGSVIALVLLIVIILFAAGGEVPSTATNPSTTAPAETTDPITVNVEYLGDPCRGYAFMSGEYMSLDPKDGHEKYVMGTSSAHSQNARIVLFDPVTLKSEDIEIPSDIGIWAMLYLPDYERLVVGTSGYYGYLHCLDMRARKWLPSLRLEWETYIWNLTRGGDGKVYGGSYPGGVLMCYDPEQHTLVSEGKAGSNPNNMYARLVQTLPNGNILVSVGVNEHETYLFDVKTRKMRQVFQQKEYADAVAEGVIRTSISNVGRFYYDADTLELLEGPLSDSDTPTNPRVARHVQNRKPYARYEELLPYPQECNFRTLKDGRVIGCFKQQIVIIEGEKVTFHDIDTEPPEMLIHSLAVADDGVVWFGAGFGNMVGYYDPKTGENWNSRPITRADGEVYGIVPLDGKVYFTAYVGGDHVVYDPKAPWDQFNNSNPKSLRSVESDKLQRPEAGSVLGPDGNIWTGWCSVYGVYGGGISRIDVQTGEVDAWFGLVPEQSIGHIAASDRYVYAVSHWMNSGLPYRFDEAFWLLRLDTDGNVVWREQFREKQMLGCMAVLNGRLYLTMRDRPDDTAKIIVYDEQTMEKLEEKVMHSLNGLGRYETEGTSIYALLPCCEDKLAMFVGKEIRLLDAETLEVLQTAKLPGAAGACAIGKDNTIYFSIDEKLYRIRFN